jgi:hypothetical protein
MWFQRVAIGWTPGDEKHDGEVSVIAINELGRSEWYDRHPMSTGGFRDDLSQLEPGSEQAKLAVLVHFHMLTVRDKVNPKKVHEAFLDINEYRDVVVADSLAADLPRWALPSMRRDLPRRRPRLQPQAPPPGLAQLLDGSGWVGRTRRAPTHVRRLRGLQARALPLSRVA